VKILPTTPFSDQRPGTSGLRKKTREFMQPRYIENFIQSFLSSFEKTGISAARL
jgi:phosphoglucomutase